MIDGVMAFLSFPENEDNSDKTDKEGRKEMANFLALILDNCSVMPFRWCAKSYFMCFYCCNSFNTSNKLKQHTKSKHKDVKCKNMLDLVKSKRIKLDVSEISCKKCPKEVQDLKEFFQHASEAHDIKFNKELSTNLVSFKLSDDGLVCLECGEMFKFFGTLLIHENEYHNRWKSFACNICGQTFVTKGNKDNHMQTVHSQKTCKICNEVFKTLYAVRKHIMTVHKKDLLKCPECPEVLESEYLKKRHMALVHNAENGKHKCEICSKEFATKVILYDHKRRIHLQEKCMTCEICGFRVFNKALLMYHMVRHDSARPFECEVCKKTFRRKKTLLVHEKTHTGERAFVCKDCGQTFNQTGNLKRHIRFGRCGKAITKKVKREIPQADPSGEIKTPPV